jgi:hypothetical protein
MKHITKAMLQGLALSPIVILVTLLFAMAVGGMLGCATPTPTPPAPTAAPTVAPTAVPTPAFDMAACLAQADADCGKACQGDPPCLTNCTNVRHKTCDKLGGN